MRASREFFLFSLTTYVGRTRACATGWPALLYSDSLTASHPVRLTIPFVELHRSYACGPGIYPLYRACVCVLGLFRLSRDFRLFDFLSSKIETKCL